MPGDKGLYGLSLGFPAVGLCRIHACRAYLELRKIPLIKLPQARVLNK